MIHLQIISRGWYCVRTTEDGRLQVLTLWYKRCRKMVNRQRAYSVKWRSSNLSRDPGDSSTSAFLNVINSCCSLVDNTLQQIFNFFYLHKFLSIRHFCKQSALYSSILWNLSYITCRYY